MTVVLAFVVVGTGLAEAVPGVARDLAGVRNVVVSESEGGVDVGDASSNGLGRVRSGRGSKGGGGEGHGGHLEESASALIYHKGGNTH